MQSNSPCKATHEEICDKALRHYEKLAKECCHWDSVIPKAIEFYKKEKIMFEPKKFHKILVKQELQKAKEKISGACQKIENAIAIMNVYKELKSVDDENRLESISWELKDCENRIFNLTPFTDERKTEIEKLNLRMDLLAKKVEERVKPPIVTVKNGVIIQGIDEPIIDNISEKIADAIRKETRERL